MDSSTAIFLSVPEAAALLRISESTLNKWRLSGFGPRYRRFGRAVRYAEADILAWAETRARMSTSEAG